MLFNFNYDESLIISELGLESSDDDFKAHTLTRVSELLDQRVSEQIVSALSAEEAKAFAQLTDTAQAQAFVAARFPDIQDIYARTLGGIVGELKRALS